MPRKTLETLVKETKNVAISKNILEINMKNRLGKYISQLMTTVVDKESDDFVKQLALDELKRLNCNIDDFLVKHEPSEVEDIEKTEKILLQEDKKDAK